MLTRVFLLVGMAAAVSVSVDAQYCSNEPGYDYVGNDIGQHYGPLDSCCDACKTSGNGCDAWTWTAYNGGTCWLKSMAYQVPAINPNATAGWCSFGLSTPCFLYRDVNFVANDIAPAQASKPQQCCAICRAIPGCRHYSWTSYNGGTCWLKSNRGRAVYEAGTISGDVYADPRAVFAIEAGVDYAGRDLFNMPRASAEECIQLCSGSVDGCEAVTWSPYNGGTCYIKLGSRDTVNRVPNGYVTSAAMAYGVDPALLG